MSTVEYLLLGILAEQAIDGKHFLTRMPWYSLAELTEKLTVQGYQQTERQILDVLDSLYLRGYVVERSNKPKPAEMQFELGGMA